MRRKIVLTVICLTLFVLAGFAWQYFSLLYYAKTPLKLATANQEPIVFIITPNLSIYDLAEQLHQRGVLNNSKNFIRLATLHDAAKHIQAGEYSITSGITPQALLDKFVHGDVIIHRFTIIEGWTFKQMMRALNNNPAVIRTLADSAPETVMHALGHDGKHPEGLFYPDTYLFKLGTRDTTLLRMAYRYMENRLNKAWAARDPHVPYQNAYQALIAASLIERESKLNEERSLVARVILNRLHKKMLLQIDAAVIYGLGDNYKGKLSRISMNIKTPYNTYMNKGLPPTPIAMPSLSSIKAALHPSDGSMLYYVVNGTGGHAFSDNYQAHRKAVSAYRSMKKLALQSKIINTKISLSFPLALSFWLSLSPQHQWCVCPASFKEQQL